MSFCTFSSVCMKAVRAALGKLEDGCSCEDAEAVCEPEVLDQIFKWKVVAYTSFCPRIRQFYGLYLIGHLKLVMEEAPFVLMFCFHLRSYL
jgi:hypothetical protein